MICRKCGKEIPDESTFCAHCGFDLREHTPSNQNHTSEEQVPLMFLINKMVKHKVVAIVTIVALVIASGGYILLQNHLEKKKAEEALEVEIERLVDLIGTYKNDNITLKLSVDNTALITYKKDGSSWNEVSCRGYWSEKYEGLIEIDFSQSLKDIYIGREKRYYCSTLYLVGNTLWESMSSIKSQDYAACEYLTKE
ncbi:MAG: zinc ribbon domain-containing protein [Bacteroidaceae bacterium]|nr:zinc ribbon domain-containing protein [Bacteroidaceae bacterium]